MELKKCKGDLAKQTALNDTLTGQVDSLTLELNAAKDRLTTLESNPTTDESIKTILE
jgi:hypothetical protein